MSDENRITSLENRINELESYLNQFESFRRYNKQTPQAGKPVNKPSELPSTTDRKRGSRLQEDWQPSPDTLDWATKDFPAVDLPLETAKFIDYWVARPDKGAIKLDWTRTYRNWIRNASSRYRSKHETNRGTNKSSYTDAVRNAFD